MPHASNHDRVRVRDWRSWGFTATDLILGRKERQLGGNSKAIDVIGINHYPCHAWMDPHHKGTIGRDPFRVVLREAYEQYGKNVFVAETGACDAGQGQDHRPGWLRYIGNELHAARDAGVPVIGACLYPIIAHSLWHSPKKICHHGLFGNERDASGRLPVHEPLAAELKRQQARFPSQSSGLAELLGTRAVPVVRQRILAS